MALIRRAASVGRTWDSSPEAPTSSASRASSRVVGGSPLSSARAEKGTRWLSSLNGFLLDAYPKASIKPP